MKRDSVMIGTVAAGPPEWSYVKSLFALQVPGEKIFTLIKGKQGIDEGHNQLNEAFLESECEWLLSLDTDAVVHPMTVFRLLSWGKPFVSALAFGRIAPFGPVSYNDEQPDGTFKRDIAMMRRWLVRYPQLMQLSTHTILQPRPDDALWSIERSGMHCLLVHREVIETVQPPWFARTGRNAKRGSGSDFYFTKKVREAGFETYLDRSVVAGHIVHGHVANALDFAVWTRCIDYVEGTIKVPIGEDDDTDNGR